MKRKTTSNLKQIKKGILNVRKAVMTEIKQATKILNARQKKLAGFETRLKSMIRRAKTTRW